MISLQRSMIEGLDGPNPSPDDVRQSLQRAIKLEHATIPVYLYALYSLDAAKNAEIASILRSVVIEEMLHMVLASNVLNAIGGTPVINTPDFLPDYPGPLPGGVQSQLTVQLAPFSPAQLQTFLTIEEPENPLNFPSAQEVSEIITIGQFYAAISRALGALPPGTFISAPRNQVGPDLMYESVVVTDAPSARKAIRTIVDQGEGTRTSPEEGVGGNYAHYYRYMQIQKGHLLVLTPGGSDPEHQYAYTGAAVTLDQSGVYAAPTNPGNYPPGSAAAFANDNFNYTYTSLLNALHQLVNGEATSDQFNRALGLMMSLKGQARAMMSGIPNPNQIVGPSFQYLEVNPAVPFSSAAG